ncbi:sensor histidine kinase [Ramlibacter sp.]|uniref:sensor histidine kinase n=1 Tax=Ramlibacter sp. TaxID=1917967 RepID=UPI0017E47D29|nr:sensor histidine kinase [Ramlibacter sp.]MBA2675851.1 PAS domain-containing protein [Ramlibacter sp.]
MEASRPPAPEVLYDTSPCGLLLAAQSGRIARANATLCRWLGYEKHELMEGRQLHDLLTIGGRIFYQTHIAPLLRMQGSVAEVKLELRHKDGSTLPMIVNMAERRGDGETWLDAAFFVVQDRHRYEHELLLERKRAQQLAEQHAQGQHELVLARTRLGLALESADLFIWDYDVHAGERRYDEGVARLLGLPGPAPVGAADYVEAIAPDDREREAHAFAKALGDGSFYRCNYRLHGRDGDLRDVVSSGMGFFDENGAVSQFVGILQDVTAANRQRTDAEDRALFAEQMVGIVSHDLRNPLSAIQMGAYLLGRGTLTDQQRTVVGRIDNSAKRAQRLIGDLLDFTQARLGSGLSVRRMPIDLHAVVADAVAELALTAKGRPVEHVRIGSGPCEADPDRLVQLLGNLVGNACTYGAPGRTITVTSTVGPEYCALAVHNHGTPIPPALQSTLFEPMVRGNNMSQGGRGVGLGLYIVREIARAHRGRVELASAAEEGTTFSVFFPPAGAR